MNTMDLDRTYIAETYRRFPIELTEGHGSILKDAQGREYIDLGSGIAVNIFGMNDEIWKQAVIAQLNQVQHASNLYYTAPQARLAEQLCLRTGMKRAFFANSGAEANECVIKTMRKYASDQYGEGKRPTIITLVNSFHGRTITTLSATGQDVFHRHFGPFTPGFVHVPANDFEAMQRAIEENAVCGIMMEMIQGEGGVLPLNVDFVQRTRQLCQERDILFAVDEVQTGNGRTGTLYAYEQFGIQPDLFSTAKGIGGGLPIGVCLLGQKVKDTLGPGDHGTTFGGNPVAAAGALSILGRIDETLLAGVRRKSAKLTEGFKNMKGVLSVTGMGLMLGVETARPAAELVSACLEKGVLMLTAKQKIRLLPALNIPDEAIDRALEIVAGVFAE